jgi:glycosyltransferase involved in cell wall biosynthesis
VLPSLREGFDIPLAEALRAGAPVAASNLPVHVEVSAGGAALFDPRDARTALAAIARARTSGGSSVLGPTWDEAALAWLRLYLPRPP